MKSRMTSSLGRITNVVYRSLALTDTTSRGLYVTVLACPASAASTGGVFARAADLAAGRLDWVDSAMACAPASVQMTATAMRRFMWFMRTWLLGGSNDWRRAHGSPRRPVG